jgi:Ser/Thr protein kinase RdoA (MazF antagonist)
MEVLRAYSEASGLAVAPLGTGLINDTYAVGDRFVLQRVHEVFAPEIHLNIRAVTEHLHALGVPTPRLVPNDRGELYTVVDGRVWRLMTRLQGRSFDAVARPEQARSAGAALARFHAGLADLDHTFVAMRSGVHDTDAHLARLEKALFDHPKHRLFAEVEPVALAILAAARSLPRLGHLRERLVHGDPKFSNVLFEGDDAVGLVDLDTVGPMPLHLELGDAWRSWCNPRGEDETKGQFDLQIFEASLHGWAGALALDPQERDALLHGVEWITVELASRFCADALYESYFGWNKDRFASRGHHNLVRARGQLAVHEAALASRSIRAALLATIAGPNGP